MPPLIALAPFPRKALVRKVMGTQVYCECTPRCASCLWQVTTPVMTFGVGETLNAGEWVLFPGSLTSFSVLYRVSEIPFIEGLSGLLKPTLQ